MAGEQVGLQAGGPGTVGTAAAPEGPVRAEEAGGGAQVGTQAGAKCGGTPGSRLRAESLLSLQCRNGWLGPSGKQGFWKLRDIPADRQAAEARKMEKMQQAGDSWVVGKVGLCEQQSGCEWSSMMQ